MIEKVKGYWDAMLIIIVGIVAFVYDLIDRFGGLDISKLIATPEQVLIFLVATLCAGLGIERLSTLHKVTEDINKAGEARASLLEKVSGLSVKVADDLDKIKAVIGRPNVAEVLLGSAIEKAALDLIDKCGEHDTIKATSQYSGTDALSDRYFDALAEKISWAKSKSGYGSMEYHVIVCSGFTAAADKRDRAFVAKNVTEKLKVRYIPHPWPFEVLIGGHSMNISLMGENGSYEAAIRITDPEFVEKAGEWFNDELWANASKAS